MKKSVLAIIMAGMMTVSLAGCQEEDRSSSPEISRDSETESTVDLSGNDSEFSDADQDDSTAITTTSQLPEEPDKDSNPDIDNNHQNEEPWISFGEATSIGGKVKIILRARNTRYGVELACELENNYSEDVSIFGKPKIIVDGYEQELAWFPKCKVSAGAKIKTDADPYLVVADGVNSIDDLDGFTGEFFTMGYTGNRRFAIEPLYRDPAVGDDLKWIECGTVTGIDGNVKVTLKARETMMGVELACEIVNDFSEEVHFFGNPSIIVDGYEQELMWFPKCETSAGSKTNTENDPYLVEGVEDIGDIESFEFELFTMGYFGERKESIKISG